MQLTAKDLRAIELANKYSRKDLAESLGDYHLLADTLIYLHEVISEKKVEIKYWQKDSEVLFYKFVFHGLTLHQILSGLELKSIYYKEEMTGKFMDIASAKTVFRSQLESFLMYHYIYVNPPNDDLKELRYNAWIYSSLLQRQEFPAETDFGKKKKEKDFNDLKKMRQFISNLSSFKTLTVKQQRSLLNSGSGKLFSHWVTILKETGFSEQNPFYIIYTLLSIYSHSEGLSIMQLSHEPSNYKNTLDQAYLDLHHSKLLVCLMILAIKKLYKPVQERFEMLPDQVKYDIELYSMMAVKEN